MVLEEDMVISDNTALLHHYHLDLPLLHQKQAKTPQYPWTTPSIRMKTETQGILGWVGLMV